MGKHGGARIGAGRKPKAQESSLIETMDAYLTPNAFWQGVALKCEEGDMAASKLWASYRFGMPKQTIDLQADVKTEQSVDLSKLTDDELRTLAEMQSKSGTGKA